VCAQTELSWLSARPAAEKVYLPKLLFSAKEAVYKCQYPLTHAKLGFLDFELALDLTRGQFTVTPLSGRHAPELSRITGAFTRHNGYLLTSALWRFPSSRLDLSPAPDSDFSFHTGPHSPP
jgi:4'-phosphopantetheinyl transferase EntD